MIRAAQPDDIGTIAGLIRDLAEYEKLGHHVAFAEADLAEHLFGARPYAEALIAELDGAPVGFALFFHSYSTFQGKPGLYLEDLFVKPEARGKGLGLGLLKRLAQLARERKCSRIDWSVLDWNEPSIRFYQALGAVPHDGWTGYRLTGEALAQLGKMD